MAETRVLRIVVAGDGKEGRKDLARTQGAIKDVGREADKASVVWGKFSRKVTQTEKALGDAAEKAQKSLGDFNLADLDRQIADVHNRIIELDRQFVVTGDRDLFKKIRQDRALFNQLKRIRSELAEVSVGFGERLTQAVGKALGGMPPQVQAALLAGIGVAAGTLAPMLGGAIAGAIVGGVGIGGVIGGVAVASQHPAVKAAATRLGGLFMAVMQDAASGFVPSVVGALDYIRGEIDSLGDDFRRIFSQAGRYVRPLTEGITQGFRNLLPGVESAIARAGPIVDEIASWGPKLGTLISDTLESLSRNADNAARALAALWTILDLGTRSLVASVNGLTIVYGWIERLSLGPRLGAIAAAQDKTKQSSEGLATSLQDVIRQFSATGDAAEAAAQPIESLHDTINRITNETLSVRQSMRDAQAAVAAATEAFKRNGATLDITTARGRENEAALDEVARSYREAANAVLQTTGQQQRANAVLEEGRRKFIALADKMGLSTAQAKALAAQLFAIPNITRDINVNNKQALTNIERVQAYLRGVRDKNITIGVRWTPQGNLKVPGGTLLKSEGGIVRGPGTGTSDSIPTRLSNGEFVLRAAAVRKLGTRFLDALNRADDPLRFKQAMSMVPPSDTSTSSGVGLAVRSIESAPPSGAGVAVSVTVNVSGSVTAERDLARSIAKAIRDEISRIGKRNGGRSGL